MVEDESGRERRRRVPGRDPSSSHDRALPSSDPPDTRTRSVVEPTHNATPPPSGEDGGFASSRAETAERTQSSAEALRYCTKDSFQSP